MTTDAERIESEIRLLEERLRRAWDLGLSSHQVRGCELLLESHRARLRLAIAQGLKP